ncbi:MAG: zinc-binding dehydrogenase [Acidimicrobiia bacterium]
MRVMVFDAPHRFVMEERPLPQPADDEVRIRIARVGICGSDLHGYTGESGRRQPGMVMGHEASGWVDEIGSRVHGLAIGDLVTFNPTLPCDGSCDHVVPQRCLRLQVIGITPELQGAFADAIVVPSNRVVPTQSLSIDQAATVEPLAVGLQVSRRLDVREDDRVLVVGAGMIGQAVAQAARVDGAEVTLSDLVEGRRRIATNAGFDAVGPEFVSDLGPFDGAVDAVGTSVTAEAAIAAVKKGGIICFVGLGVPEVSIPLFEVVVSERTIVGSFGYTHNIFNEAVSRLRDGELDVGPLIGDVVDFDDAPQAFEDLATHARHDVKILVSTGAEPPN